MLFRSDVSFAAAVALTVSTGTVEASIANATVTADDKNVLTTDDIKVKASSTQTITTKADGSQTSKDATGVGIGAAIGIVDTDTLATLGGATTSLTATDITLSALMPSSTYTVEAKSGASSSGTAIAGSFAMNLVFIDTGAKVLAGSNVNLHGANLILDSQATTQSETKGLAAGRSEEHTV